MARKTHSMVTIEVTGRGEFPMDMLRRDYASPARSEDAERIAALMQEVRETGWSEGVTWENPIRLNVFATGGPTLARWDSFGWLAREVV